MRFVDECPEPDCCGGGGGPGTGGLAGGLNEFDLGGPCEVPGINLRKLEGLAGEPNELPYDDDGLPRMNSLAADDLLLPGLDLRTSFTNSASASSIEEPSSPRRLRALEFDEHSGFRGKSEREVGAAHASGEVKTQTANVRRRNKILFDSIVPAQTSCRPI